MMTTQVNAGSKSPQTGTPDGSAHADVSATNAGTPKDTPLIDSVAINTIRTLSMDAVQKAKSGHPGAPMGLAPVAYTLWQHALTYDPANPHWPNRDRFVLSNGHASMLLYSLIYLSGVVDESRDGTRSGKPALTLDDLKSFRQLHSKCPGHPEFGETTGVETTTGPLGQGIGNSVGMAAALKFLATRYNRPGFQLFDAHVWTVCGDGDLEEGISHEAAGLAGHWQVNNLTWIYDSNKITIEGETALAFTDDTAARFQAMGWNVLHVECANDVDALQRAFAQAKTSSSKPTMIVVRSVIAWGAPTVAGTAKAHGEPLGDEEIKKTKEFYGWPSDRQFWVPPGVTERFQELLGARGSAAHQAWTALRAKYARDFPELSAELDHIAAGTLPEGWESALPVYPPDAKGKATRASGGEVLNALVQRIPWLMGGAADLAPSTKTLTKGVGTFNAPAWKGTYDGRNMHFGIREHGMGSAVNGMTLTGVRAFGAGFFIFTDYMKPALRLSAIMHLPCLWIFTHDSIGVGEDGPTHQPIEQLAALRAVPNTAVWRPCDANETAQAYRWALTQTRTPTCMALTRQDLPTLDRTQCAPAEHALRGGYVLREAQGLASGALPDVILIGTGSEVHQCLEAQEAFQKSGIRARVVSLPCWFLFQAQDPAYRDEVLPSRVRARVGVEAAAETGWGSYLGLDGEFVGMHTFGASAPASQTLKHFGFTSEAVVAAAQRSIKRTVGFRTQ
jgi:transketolase